MGKWGIQQGNTVAKLIEKLKTLPQDYIVTIDTLDMDFEEINVYHDYKEVNFWS